MEGVRGRGNMGTNGRSWREALQKEGGGKKSSILGGSEAASSGSTAGEGHQGGMSLRMLRVQVVH